MTEINTSVLAVAVVAVALGFVHTTVMKSSSELEAMLWFPVPQHITVFTLSENTKLEETFYFNVFTAVSFFYYLLKSLGIRTHFFYYLFINNSDTLHISSEI